MPPIQAYLLLLIALSTKDYYIYYRNRINRSLWKMAGSGY